MQNDSLVNRSLDRRRFLRLGAGTAGAFGFGLPCLGAQAAGRKGDRGEGDPGGTLVLIQLSGGNDGLSTVVPFGEDGYHRVRSTTRLEEKDVLRLDERRGLHPALGKLREQFDRGALAIVEGVGYPRPNRSHFKSMEIWHAADPRGRRVGTGWVGRLVEQAFPMHDPLRVIHVGATAPFSLASEEAPPLAFVSPAAYRRIGFEDEAGGYPMPAAGEPTGGALDHVRRVLAEAEASSARLREAVASYEPRVEYPDQPFAAGLRTIAAILEAGVGARVLSIELSGFDTHNDQRRRHDRQMEQLDAALGPFLLDLEESAAGRSALVCAFSEFGRRVAENGSRGTDHGTAAPLFVAGTRVVGGFHGESPSLDELDEGDLIHTTDFRSVYATLIEDLFGLPAERVLGKPWPRLGFV